LATNAKGTSENNHTRIQDPDWGTQRKTTSIMGSRATKKEESTPFAKAEMGLWCDLQGETNGAHRGQTYSKPNVEYQPIQKTDEASKKVERDGTRHNPRNLTKTKHPGLSSEEKKRARKNPGGEPRVITKNHPNRRRVKKKTCERGGYRVKNKEGKRRQIHEAIRITRYKLGYRDGMSTKKIREWEKELGYLILGLGKGGKSNQIRGGGLTPQN